MKKRTPFYTGLFPFLVIVTGLLLSSGAALAGKLSLTFATTTPPKSNLEIASENFIKAVSLKTGGRIEIKHYGAGSLYNAKTIMPAISNGQVDIGILHVALVGRRSPVLEFIGSFGAQGCWNGNDHYFRFIDNPRTRTIASAEFEKYFKSKLLAPLRKSIIILLGPAFVLGSIYTGLATPTEAGAILVLYSLFCALVFRKIDVKGFVDCIVDASVLSTMILMIMIGALIMSNVITLLQVPSTLTQAIVGSGMPTGLVLFCIVVFILIIGVGLVFAWPDLALWLPGRMK